MSRVLAIVLVSLAGCGSGSNDSAPPALFGGFTPASGAAAILAPATCDVPFVGSASVSAVLLELTSRSDACDVLTAARQCGTGAGSTIVLAAAVSRAVGGSVGPTGPGTYPWLANPPTGTFAASIASAGQADASCNPLAGSPVDTDGGRITLTAVTPSRVTGRTNLHFENGQVFDYEFDVAVCPVSIDICSLFQPCFTRVCVP